MSLHRNSVTVVSTIECVIVIRKDRIMRGLIGHVKAISLRLRWVFMSPQARYACLWTRTKKLYHSGYTVRDTAVSANK
jgi:hypothetical protein